MSSHVDQPSTGRVRRARPQGGLYSGKSIDSVVRRSSSESEVANLEIPRRTFSDLQSLPEGVESPVDPYNPWIQSRLDTSPTEEPEAFTAVRRPPSRSLQTRAQPVTLNENSTYSKIPDAPAASSSAQSRKPTALNDNRSWTPDSSAVIPSIQPGRATTEEGSRSRTPDTPVPPAVHSRRPTALSEEKFTRSTTPDSYVPPSPSRARWDNLRQHVMSPLSSSSSLQLQQQPTAGGLVPPTRSQTPVKPSRLARLGFFQVVEHAREAVNREAYDHRLAHDIQKACWGARYRTNSTKAVSKFDTLVTGSPLYLPFMANLPASSASAINLQNAGFTAYRKDPRRPQSIQSLASMASRAEAVGLLELQQLLVQNLPSPRAQQAKEVMYLPHETLVLSTLLAPFLALEIGKEIEEERTLALDTLEVIVNSWRPLSRERAVDRCIWCCKAASTQNTALRTRVLGILQRLILPQQGSNPVPATTSATLQGLVQALFMLRQSLSGQIDDGDPGKGLKIVGHLIEQVAAGCCGDMDVASLEEDFGIAVIQRDEGREVRKALVAECYARTIETGTERCRRWVLNNLEEVAWPVGRSLEFTPLLMAIHSRKITSYAHASVSLLQELKREDPERQKIASTIARTVQTKVIPEAEAIHGHTAEEIRIQVCRLVLELLAVEESHLRAWSATLIGVWYGENNDKEWLRSFENSLQRLILDSDWLVILHILAPVVNALPDLTRQPVVVLVLPHICERLVSDPPPYPCQPLTSFLESISLLYPPVFYKPLFACAKSSKELTIASHLCTIMAISRFLGDFWTRDPEMISVALMSDAGGKVKPKAASDGQITWAKPKLGQYVILVELIRKIKKLRKLKEASPDSDVASPVALKFVIALDTRLGILLDAKEKSALVPLPQRHFFCTLLLELRLFSRSLKPCPWLSRLISWFTTFHFANLSDDDTHASLTQLSGLYGDAREGSKPSNKRQSTTLLSPGLEKSVSSKGPTSMDDLFADIEPIFTSLSRGFASRVLETLVTLSGLMTLEDYRTIGPLVWNYHLEVSNPKATTSACFLIMQWAERVPDDFFAVVKLDFHSEDSSSKISAVRKMSILSNWRYQILSQNIITDRNYRRPFKLAKGPLPFVATDIGSTLFIPQDDEADAKDTVPLELRKRLFEIGWTEEDKPVDQKQAWIKTPMSLLSGQQLDRLEGGADTSITSPSPQIKPGASPQKGISAATEPSEALVRRRSSSGGPLYGAKRKAVFVPAVTALFPDVVALALDRDFAVASAARSVTLDLMRNDPALLTRPMFDLFAEGENSVAAAISILRKLLVVRRLLPPAMAHHIFNSLTGFLKTLARHVEAPESFLDFAYTLPLLSKIVTQVSDMSIREIRRAKVEIFFIPSGSLWFPVNAPSGPMFPRSLDSLQELYGGLPSRLVSIVIIRLSQNMFFLAMLKHNPQEVQMVRKSLTKLVLPSVNSDTEPSALELNDFIPHKLGINRRHATPTEIGLRGLSLMVARTYLLLVAQIFRSMSRHLNDRKELAILVEGINRILLSHGDEIGIVTQALIALMVASTRFRRMFISGGGYTLFMPTIIKTYAEASDHPGIQLAIVYTTHRFYAQHHENFLFQTFDVVSHMAMMPNSDGEFLAKSVYQLFSTLSSNISSSTPDAAGIHNANKLQEREALLITTAEEKPQTFLASLKQEKTQGRNVIALDVPEEYETRRLSMENLVRLFLTVIAHDANVARAEHFLRFFRLSAPYLTQASPNSRSTLRDGIDALGSVLLRISSKAKTGETSYAPPIFEAQSDLLRSDNSLKDLLQDVAKNPSDIHSMRVDFLGLVAAFTKAGGQLKVTTSRQVLELVRLMLRDSSVQRSEEISTFLSDWTSSTLIRDVIPSVKDVLPFLSDLAPMVNAYAIAVDFSGVFEAVTQVVLGSNYAGEFAFSNIVVDQFCAAGLAACELAASEKLLLQFPLRPKLVTLMAHAIYLRGADIVRHIENCKPSYELLSGVVLPLVMSLRLSSDDGSSQSVRTEGWHKNAFTRTWIRLLSYTMSACQKQDSRGPVVNVLRAPNAPIPSSRSPKMTTLITAIQIVKAIIIRASDEISASLPDIWSRIASFFKLLLDEGNARFATEYQGGSAFNTPSHSPRASISFAANAPPPVFPSFSIPQPEIPVPQQYSSPRVVDYAMWSLLEMLCICRNPLMIQMRSFIQEKLFILDQDLIQRNPAMPTSPRSRRGSTSAFSKPRHRMSDQYSPISPSVTPTFEAAHVSRQAGYHGFGGFGGPVSPRPHENNIIHLGPQTGGRSGFRRSLSPSGAMRGGARLLAKSSKVKSLVLVRKTYMRIRLVQRTMGYESLLLPLPSCEQGGVEEQVAWSRKEALEAVIRETKELMDEFEENYEDGEDVDEYQPPPGLSVEQLRDLRTMTGL